MACMKPQPLLLTLILLTLSSAVSADFVYKCKSSEGRKVFSGLPCGPHATREEYRNLAPARKVAEDLPPRQGELLNGTASSKEDMQNSNDKGSKKK
ncbi:DUF4124 domain-containing protein [Neptunomonas japonica]|uniref:DUF4124 domain-containing protein n=1 Tax=Neptunomonas japonica TaxID=417574 RepID=UPI0019160984|nr:DUF4124 domain-containing protein [Neptunomonas japonica]